MYQPPNETNASATVGYPLTGHTLVIPTFNRPELLYRLVTYYSGDARVPNLLVLDSSSVEIVAKNSAALARFGSKVRHIAYPASTPVAVKLSLGLAEVATPTVSFCADDDLVFIEGLQQARAFLLDNPDYVCAHGLYLNFREHGLDVHVTREYAGESNEAGHAGARIFRLCQNYESLFYGVFRTGDLLNIFSEAPDIPSLHFQELFQSVAALILGKVKRLPIFYAGRRSGPEAEPGRDKWQTYYWFADDPVEFLEHYSAYQKDVAEFYAAHGAAPRLSNGEFSRILDVTHSMYFSKGCPPAYFHDRLHSYWPDDGFVKDPADLFRVLRRGTTGIRLGAVERLVMKLLRFVRRRLKGGNSGNPADMNSDIASLDFETQKVCRSKWRCHLARGFVWVAANPEFRDTYRELCAYLDKPQLAKDSISEEFMASVEAT